MLSQAFHSSVKFSNAPITAGAIIGLTKTLNKSDIDYFVHIGFLSVFGHFLCAEYCNRAKHFLAAGCCIRCHQIRAWPNHSLAALSRMPIGLCGHCGSISAAKWRIGPPLDHLRKLQISFQLAVTQLTADARTAFKRFPAVFVSKILIPVVEEWQDFPDFFGTPLLGGGWSR
jgi:hypothetical protein